jgi:tetratricopeptide (TPR) repeat protein
MFYLAQTYHSLGRYEDSIKMYKRRFKAGGWDEERWYSLYMIAQCYLSLKDPIKFESYMLRAYALRPGRAESLYKLTKYFRETSQHYKAYHYCTLGQQIPLSTDSLFIETDVYTDLIEYVATILDYYVNKRELTGTCVEPLHHYYCHVCAPSFVVDQTSQGCRVACGRRQASRAWLSLHEGSPQADLCTHWLACFVAFIISINHHHMYRPPSPSPSSTIGI